MAKAAPPASEVFPEDEPTTLTECPRCLGVGALARDVVREHDDHGHLTVRGQPCFVCDGLGAALPYQNVTWLWMTGQLSRRGYAPRKE